MDWQDINNAPRSTTDEIIVAGQFPNGVWYVVTTFWNSQGHWNGWKLNPMYYVMGVYATHESRQ